MLLTLRIARSARVTIWTYLLSPVRPSVAIELGGVASATDAASVYRPAEDWRELAVAIRNGLVTADIGGNNITGDECDVIATSGGLLTIGTGGGGGSSDAIVDDVPYNCDPGIAVLDLVYISAPDTVDKADANAPGTFPAIGVVVSKPTATTCKVQYAGKLGGFVGLTANATYFASTSPGAITPSPTVNPGDVTQRIGWARDATTLVLTVDRDFIIN